MRHFVVCLCLGFFSALGPALGLGSLSSVLPLALLLCCSLASVSERGASYKKKARVRAPLSSGPIINRLTPSLLDKSVFAFLVLLSEWVSSIL